MAAGDLIQLAMCTTLLRVPRAPLEPAEPHASAAGYPAGSQYKLGAVMLVMYFSAYLNEPFFAAYWERIEPWHNDILAGSVFAIPGLSALLGLFVNARRGSDEAPTHKGVLFAVGLCLGSLWLQATGLPLCVVSGRFAYGWALFQIMVRLDALLFQASHRDSYATEFSRINTFQGLGVLFASYTAGNVVSAFGPQATFTISAGGFAFGALLFAYLFRHALWPRARALGAGEFAP
jgi:hypothetical protein